MHTKARLNLSFRGFNLKSIATHYVQRVVLCDNAQVLKLTVNQSIERKDIFVIFVNIKLHNREA